MSFCTQITDMEVEIKLLQQLTLSERLQKCIPNISWYSSLPCSIPSISGGKQKNSLPRKIARWPNTPTTKRQKSRQQRKYEKHLWYLQRSTCFSLYLKTKNQKNNSPHILGMNNCTPTPPPQRKNTHLFFHFKAWHFFSKDQTPVISSPNIPPSLSCTTCIFQVIPLRTYAELVSETNQPSQPLGYQERIFTATFVWSKKNLLIVE